MPRTRGEASPYWGGVDRPSGRFRFDSRMLAGTERTIFMRTAKTEHSGQFDALGDIERNLDEFSRFKHSHFMRQRRGIAVKGGGGTIGSGSYDPNSVRQGMEDVLLPAEEAYPEDEFDSYGSGEMYPEDAEEEDIPW